MSFVKTMKAVYVDEQGGVDNLIYGDLPVPQVTDDSVLVKNHVAGVNFIDTYHRSGLYPVQLPGYALGCEGAGEIIKVGSNVKDFKVGDRVCYLSNNTYAEYTLVDQSKVQKLNDDMSYEEGAAIGIQALTAWTMIRESYYVKKGDVILVHAAAGGVGLILCQMLHYLGATVIGTVSTDEKAKMAREHGADHVIIYTREDVVDRVNELTNGLGCHAVYDGVGKSTFESSLACTRRLGSLISFGNASGAVPPVELFKLTPKNLKLLRPRLYGYMVTHEESQKWWKEILELYSKKVFKLNIHKVYNLKDAKQVHVDLESRKTTGKLLIKI